MDSIYEVKYYNLLSKLDCLSEIKENDEGGEYAISESAIFATKEVIKKLSELKIIEQKIAIHLFANKENGVQIELDSDALKADIEISREGIILFTKYTGENNKIEENSFPIDNLYLLNEYLTLNEVEHA